MRRFVIDTNVYIDALRSRDANTALAAFYSALTPFVYLSAVVAHELRAGVRDEAAARLDATLLAPFEQRNRVVTPTYTAWKESGRVLAEIVGRGDWRRVTRSFVNDVLLAMSCRESGMTLITNNVGDCRRIAAVREFDFLPPWPMSRSE